MQAPTKKRRAAGYFAGLVAMAVLFVCRVHQGEIRETLFGGIEDHVAAPTPEPAPVVEHPGPAAGVAENVAGAEMPEPKEIRYQPGAESLERELGHSGSASGASEPVVASSGLGEAMGEDESAGADNSTLHGTSHWSGGPGGGFGGGGGRFGGGFGGIAGTNGDGSPASFFLIADDSTNNLPPTVPPSDPFAPGNDSGLEETGNNAGDTFTPFVPPGGGNDDGLPNDLNVPDKNDSGNQSDQYHEQNTTDGGPDAGPDGSDEGENNPGQTNPWDQNPVARVPDTGSTLGLVVFAMLCLSAVRRRITR